MTSSQYDDYLESPHWRRFKSRYRFSLMPQRCLGCDYGEVDLHHCTYERMGHEELTDVAPFCRECHQRVHDWLSVRYPGLSLADQVKHTFDALVHEFQWKDYEVRNLKRNYYEPRVEKPVKKRKKKLSKRERRRRAMAAYKAILKTGCDASATILTASERRRRLARFSFSKKKAN